ncbi:MAG TPA: hypothetical protein VLB72_08920 [Burkholderiales bacterium]|nr:hypothetical protein [Burkholderiales bacterium]
MLREIEGIADEPRTRRRWFHNEYFDLFVWQTDEGDITLFQLCYGIGASERALVWHRTGGFFHDGAGPAKPAGADKIVARFEVAAQPLPVSIRDTVSERIREYLAGEQPASARRKRFRREDWQKRPAA